MFRVRILWRFRQLDASTEQGFGLFILGWLKTGVAVSSNTLLHDRAVIRWL